MGKNVVIGGEAGEGIKEAANLFSRLLVKRGFYVHTYHDYPSLIRGGHNYSSVRFSLFPVRAPRKEADVIVVLDERSVERRKENEVTGKTVWIVDSSVKGISGKQYPIREIAKGVMRSTAIFGILLKTFGIPVEEGLEIIKELKDFEKNREILLTAYGVAEKLEELEQLESEKGSYISGSEAVALGAVDGGLDIYIAYPMTPASPVLHFLAAHKKEFGIKVIQPENEIAAINMVAGAAFAGGRAMTGTSGGGFALMTETLSMAGMAELPVVIYEAQRGAPSTGVPTYTEQADLLFALFAGHGDFQRIILAPGNAEECYKLTRDALNLAWKFRVPVIVLSSKNVAESFFTSVIEREKSVEKLPEFELPYKPYRITDSGISPLAFPGTKGVVVKSNSYEHDEWGITTENPQNISAMKEKRARKQATINSYFLQREDTVKVGGNTSSKRVMVTWGECGGVCEEAGEALGYKVVRPIVLEPFPHMRLKRELENAEEVIVVELSISGQFEKLLRLYGVEATRKIRKYDTRPLFLEELMEKLS